MSYCEILAPIKITKKNKERLKIKCFTDLGNVFTYSTDVLSLYSSLLKSHLFSWLGRWLPNYASHTRQVPTPRFHLSVGHSDLNTPTGPQKQHVCNTLSSTFISNLLLFYFCSCYHHSPCIWVFLLTLTLKLVVINPTFCFFWNLSYLYLFLF